MRILLAEDDPVIGESVRLALMQEGHAVDWVKNGPAVDATLGGETYDLMLLDLGLPGKDGLEVLHGLRSREGALPVIVLTVRDAVTDRVAGLDAGEQTGSGHRSAHCPPEPCPRGTGGRTERIRVTGAGLVYAPRPYRAACFLLKPASRDAAAARMEQRMRDGG